MQSVNQPNTAMATTKVKTSARDKRQIQKQKQQVLLCGLNSEQVDFETAYDWHTDKLEKRAKQRTHTLHGKEKSFKFKGGHRPKAKNAKGGLVAEERRLDEAKVLSKARRVQTAQRERARDLRALDHICDTRRITQSLLVQANADIQNPGPRHGPKPGAHHKHKFVGQVPINLKKLSVHIPKALPIVDEKLDAYLHDHPVPSCSKECKAKQVPASSQHSPANVGLCLSTAPVFTSQADIQAVHDMFADLENLADAVSDVPAPSPAVSHAVVAPATIKADNNIAAVGGHDLPLEGPHFADIPRWRSVTPDVVSLAACEPEFEIGCHRQVPSAKLVKRNRFYTRCVVGGVLAALLLTFYKSCFVTLPNFFAWCIFVSGCAMVLAMVLIEYCEWSERVFSRAKSWYSKYTGKGECSPLPKDIPVLEGRVLESHECVALLTPMCDDKFVHRLTVVPVGADDRIIADLGIPVINRPYELACISFRPIKRIHWVYVLLFLPVVLSAVFTFVLLDTEAVSAANTYLNDNCMFDQDFEITANFGGVNASVLACELLRHTGIDRLVSVVALMDVPVDRLGKLSLTYWKVIYETFLVFSWVVSFIPGTYIPVSLMNGAMGMLDSYFTAGPGHPVWCICMDIVAFGVWSYGSLMLYDVWCYYFPRCREVKRAEFELPFFHNPIGRLDLSTARNLYYVPHLVSTVLRDYALDADYNAGRTIRQRLLCVPNFPLSARDSAQVLDGTEMVVRFLLQNRNFTLPAGFGPLDSAFLKPAGKRFFVRGDTGLPRHIYRESSVLDYAGVNLSNQPHSALRGPRTTKRYLDARYQALDQSLLTALIQTLKPKGAIKG